MKIINLCTVLMLSSPAIAETYWASDVRVTGLAVVAADPDYPEFSDTVWVGIDKTDFLPKECTDGAAGGLIFPASKTALQMMVLRAADSRKSVTIKVDAAHKIGDLCQLFQVTEYFGPHE